jgi:uncharacterized protein YbcC (UPF0753/DUF2309 family)
MGHVLPERWDPEHAIEAVGHLLPAQGPLHAFVHHNTLHAFEHLPFEEAVVVAGDLYGTEPFQTEDQFAAHLASGRILDRDLDAVVSADWSAAVPGREIVPGLDELAFRRGRLRFLFPILSGPRLAWEKTETLLLEQFDRRLPSLRVASLAAHADREFAHLPGRSARVAAFLSFLWECFERAAARRPVRVPDRAVRRRDQLIRAGGRDVDRMVHPVLIHWVSAFVDQGIALWPLPDRDAGLLRAVRRALSKRAFGTARWLTDARAELAAQDASDWDAIRTIEWALDALGVPDHQRSGVLQATTLSLRGFAGMVHQLELRPDRAPVRAVPARLVEHVALHLLLEALASRHELARFCGRSDAGWADLPAAASVPQADDGLVYECFLLAQALDVAPDTWADARHVAAFVDAVAGFDAIIRRRFLHRAYERRFRVQVLDALAAQPQAEPEVGGDGFQALFCIDERECSTRRLLEESRPSVETFGVAGFFGVAMSWQAIGAARSRPLCPVQIVPRHFVTERALCEDERNAWLRARRRIGKTAHTWRAGHRSAARGGVLSTLFGLAGVVPMVGRCLFPRVSERIAHHVEPAPPPTRLVFERVDDARTEAGLHQGFTVQEMTDIVEGVLRSIGLTSRFRDVVLVVGHGSASLNNPHESAHDCGATGGGRGGPNARVFAAMANHPGVRTALAARGIPVPDATWFVGCYHNTCDDAFVCYDEDLIPAERVARVEEAKVAMRDACAQDAQERCRRFESAPERGGARRALAHVEGRAVDLAQPRPEYGHATNAAAIVGRRAWTRGLFLDRRAFLVSYDPTQDAEGHVLERILGAVVPVGAGINLEYYFSFVDPTGYGCGTKLPHNITGLVGVMDGHQSDLRTGLPWQMVEIHEPVRLLTVVEARPEVLEGILARNPDMDRFVRNGWVQLVAACPTSHRMWEFGPDGFHAYEPECRTIPEVRGSVPFFAGERRHLGCVRIAAGARPAAASAGGVR